MFEKDDITTILTISKINEILHLADGHHYKVLIWIIKFHSIKMYFYEWPCV